MRRVFSLIAVMTALSTLASGYYHYVYFPNRTAPFNTVINLQFDPAQFPNDPNGHFLVPYLISDAGPGALMPGDSFNALISEIQLAASAWNGVSTSQLRLVYGGLESAMTQQTTPGIDVVFDDNMPPGLVAQTKVTTYNNVSFIANGNTNFLPILRSKVQLRHDLTNPYQQASYNDLTFTTIVHEFGHSIGLQHTMTSAVMATAFTRATTKSAPLGADDIAGVSLLYPAPGFLAATGSISGRVTLSGNGVNLASVVALSMSGTGTTSGVAISALTNPDGQYRIDGLPPGQYLVYVHPLPPPASGEFQPAGIQLPQDAAQNSFPANTGFVTQFYTGTRDWTQAVQNQISVTAGNVSNNVNFNVQPSAGPAIYGMTTYGYSASSALIGAEPLLPANGGYAMLFSANGATQNHQLVPGLSVSVIGNAAYVPQGYNAQFSTTYNGLDYVYFGVVTNQVSSTTPVALAVTTPNDLYVLPAALYVVQSGPPTISSLFPAGTDSNGNSLLNVAGSNLNSSTQIVFDGTSAPVQNVNSDGSLTVLVPQAPGGYQAMVEALNPDGQTSGQPLGTNLPMQYSYNGSAAGTINSISASVLPGADMWVQISVSGPNFLLGQALGQVTVGFGSSDIAVKHVWVVDSGTLLVNVSVSATAPPALADLTVSDGLVSVTADLKAQILSANPHQISLRAPVLNKTTQKPGVPPGGTALITATGLPLTLAGWKLTIGYETAAFFLNSSGQIEATVPSGLLSGPQPVQLSSPNKDNIPPILMQVDQSASQ